MTLSIVFTIVLVELLVVAWMDFKLSKISNKWILVNLVASVLFHIVAGSLYPLSWEVIIFPTGFIVVGFFLYLLNVMGAGDSKYLASLFFIVPLEFHLLFFEKLVICSIITGTLLFLYRIYSNRVKLRSYFANSYWEGIRETIRSRFSYAPVICLAWIILGMSIWK